MQNFEIIAQEMAVDLQKINEIILNFAHGKSDLVKQITTHIIASGGKRIRPILHLICCQICESISGKNNSQFKTELAAAIELIHTATLLHDDVIDNSYLRRNKKTANAIWDNKASILVGDFLFSLSFQLMVLTKNFKVLELLAKTSSTIADGEIMQLQLSSNINLTITDYFEIIFGKTAILFSAACETAAINNNCELEVVSAMRNFGKNLGMIFQITDDILDYEAGEKELGKEVGNDFFEGKITLPIILALQKANSVQRDFLQQALAENRLSTSSNQEKLHEVLLIFNDLEVINAAKSVAKKFYDDAKQEIQIFRDSPIKSKLDLVLNYAIGRV